MLPFNVGISSGLDRVITEEELSRAKMYRSVPSLSREDRVGVNPLVAISLAQVCCVMQPTSSSDDMVDADGEDSDDDTASPPPTGVDDDTDAIDGGHGRIALKFRSVSSLTDAEYARHTILCSEEYEMAFRLLQRKPPGKTVKVGKLMVNGAIFDEAAASAFCKLLGMLVHANLLFVERPKQRSSS